MKSNRPTVLNQPEPASGSEAASGGPPDGSADVAAVLRSGVPPDVATVIEEWMPRRITAEQRRLLPVVLLFVRCCVKAAQPTNQQMARQMMRATTLLAVWAYAELRSLALEVVFSVHNVEHFSTCVNRHRSKSWKHQTRWVLRCVGRKLNPDGWPLELPMVGKRLPSMPYSIQAESGFRFAVMASEASNRVSRRVLVAATLGGGCQGTEAVGLTPDDVVALAGGRFAVNVRGRNPRLVPIRAAYCELLHEAVKESNGGRFFRGSGRNMASLLAERLLENPAATNRRKGLSLRRARSTWLAAHLAANTPLPALRVIAGPLSWNTMDSLIEHVSAEIDPQEAVAQGMKA